ncbi:DUF5655 domain-containing protein [Methanococcus maripaludis]|uniref:DUF5655 domain-containing protein n=1 Tax=Methanococcus maripaludis OS7 TaxID=637915 RepID=A0A2Z5PM84_METMI|nr:DUF5655 domain-containing protein [Methanococcus maripaludis]BAP62906.1 hypothetical protein MMOS7_08200 [Methanococcus maripaludis OS7]
MSLFKISGKSVEKMNSTKNIERKIQNLCENNLEEIFGVKFLRSEYPTTTGGRMDSLGIDFEGNPVIIEYKQVESENIITQGLFYLDWLIDHKGDFEQVLNKAGVEMEVSWDSPRVILVAKSYSKYDTYAVNQFSGNIELWKYMIYDDEVLHIERINLAKDEKEKAIRHKSRVTYQTYEIDHHLAGKPENIVNLYYLVRDEILKLDENISEKINKYYIAYSLDRQFCEFLVQKNALKVYINVTNDELNDPKNLSEDVSGKGHWPTGHTCLKVEKEEDIHYTMELIKQSYEKNL